MRRRRLASAVTVVFLALNSVAAAQGAPPRFEAASKQILECVDKYIDAFKPSRVDIETVKGHGAICADLITKQHAADLAAASNAVFVNQRFSTNVLLWMVVAITLSGVGLAALQLLGSYRLAQSGHGSFAEGSEANLSSGAVAVKSSVVGVIILALSLAFFIVFVRYVYPITTLSTSSNGRTEAVGGEVTPDKPAAPPSSPSP
jgi:hypothetical protein